MPTVLERARAYAAAGFSVIPIRPDGSKGPAVLTWKEFQQYPPGDGQLYLWFAQGRNGIAIVCGAVSRNLEVLDFDDRKTFEAWAVKLETDCPGLLARLPIVTTPDDGRHVYYRLKSRPAGNRKLARDSEGGILIETRGEGGYVLAPGCPSTCHPSGKTYVEGSVPIVNTPVLEGQP